MNHINPNGFVKLDNKIGMYAILGYSKNKDIQVNSTTLNIYRALLQHKCTDENSPLYGKAWVSIERLAIELALGEKTVRRHLNILKNVGLIVVGKLRKGQGTHNVYHIMEPMTMEEFVESFPEEVEEYERRLDELERSYEQYGNRPIEVQEWAIAVKRRDRRVCQACGNRGGLMVAHHLDGYHWATDKQTDINNGITLCTFCHNQSKDNPNSFHSVYGNRNNTAEQFLEWINKYGKYENGKELAYELYGKLRKDGVA